MPLFRILGAIALAVSPFLALAEGELEVPSPFSYQSGIGLITGWHCSAARIEVSIDLGAPILVSSHTPREDTRSVCGRSDTGFAMPFNWNLLKETGCCDIGEVNYHRVIVFADGVPFADTKVYTTKFGYNAEYLTGKSGTYILRNFPDFGNAAWVTWDQDKQNFSIIESQNYSQLGYPGFGASGIYVGAVTVSGKNICGSPFVLTTPQVRYGKFIVETSATQLQFRAEYADGGVCQLPPVPLRPERPLFDGAVRAKYGPADVAACPELGGSGLELSANGKVLDAVSTASCNQVTITGATPARNPSLPHVPGSGPPGS